jgi:hypothetical protein
MSSRLKIRAAFISSIPCEATFGGPIQMYRHFKERDDFDLREFAAGTADLWTQWLGPRLSVNPFFRRLLNTRLFPWALMAANTTLIDRQAASLIRELTEWHPEMIVTVAYGRYAFVAERVARQLRVPLVIFIHDWWPDLLPACRGLAKSLLDRAYLRLFRRSALALCVCDNLVKDLGSHVNAVVLPPIPGSSQRLATAPSSFESGRSSTPILAYVGNLQGPYGGMIRRLADYVAALPKPPFLLRCYGRADEWPADEIKRHTAAGIYGGVPQHGKELDQILSEADALLVVMNFEAADRRRVRTSFPSKIPDSVPWGKPLVIWAPEYSSAAQFARQEGIGPIVSQDTPAAVVEAFRAMMDSGAGPSMAARCRALAVGAFDPEKIHRRLLDKIDELLRRHREATS